ncbi:cupin domain-containing protein [Bradyrhizobium sp. Bra78]|uniref:cupin domain-containing protein n=1 Tax=Bradyrhizobium sp. Bra78 TaxID=2926010 RepID=UPI0021C76392|nr:cupin domain-containing protein [Bradyrhizobium sp. Bra78]
MQFALIEAGRCDVDLTPSPVEPSWIIDGNPEARSHVLSTSACGTAKTMIWSCTEGKFNWYYDLDETIVIIEGSIVLESKGVPPKRFRAGDVIVFHRGAHAKWHVEGYVKKVAFLRLNNPVPLGFAIRAVNKLRSLVARSAPVMAAACVIIAE